jgi:hypothetical protein
MEKIIPRIVPMTPYEVYLQRVKSTYDNIRYARKAMAYTPAQFGGIFGQEAVANSGSVLEITDFEIK